MKIIEQSYGETKLLPYYFNNTSQYASNGKLMHLVKKDKPLKLDV